MCSLWALFGFLLGIYWLSFHGFKGANRIFMGYLSFGDSMSTSLMLGYGFYWELK